MSTVDLHTLTGAYALGALSEQESAEFTRHLAQCPACYQEVRELQETAARLALAVAEVPPAGLRTRVMAALPEVRQLPPRGRHATVVPLRRGMRHRLPYLAAAACLVVAALAGGLAVQAQTEADEQRDRSVRAEQQAAAVSALMTAPDATFHTTALKGGGSGTVVASQRRGQTAFLYHGLPALSGQRVYELWYSRNGAMEPAGLVRTGSTSGAMLLTGGPQGADGVGVTAEPQGGSSRPTTAPLAVLRL
ncbi:anti-sigma factor [Streptomyces sp. RPA4-5]|uniref:anti-sigma factor n=1 Tax=unclassified Streptomyces TaxID=2593676 RepID=UPI00143EB717|nr:MULTISPECIES: anti-sigma factor [unclassified Streptomyces]QIY59283.1 anti-sigma factor [Streptomyces sp. RPA4-5]WJY42524.1 anti-sigma factor [Streptomyces sp. P9-2B-2]